MIFFLTFVLFSAVSVGCESQTSQCQNDVQIICSQIEENSPWDVIGSQRQCKGHKSIKSIISGSSVSSVVHNGLEVSNLVKITALNIDSATVEFIPFGIKKHFPNLKALHISSCGLLSVNKKNLKELGNSLEALSLTWNKLVSIDADLFQYNPNLKAVWLYNNPFRHIDPEFFTYLKNLRNLAVVSLTNAGCIDQEFDKQKGDNLSAFYWFHQLCTDSTAKVHTQNLITGTSISVQDDKIKMEISEIRRENAELRRENGELKKSIDDIKLQMAKFF